MPSPLYDAMAFIVMPRWFGDKDDLSGLAYYYAASHPNYHNTDGLYVRVVEQVVRGVTRTPEEVLSYGFSWPIIKSGYIHDAKFQGMPTWRLEVFSWLAVLYNDKPTAKVLFTLLRDQYSPYTWGEDAMLYNKAKSWAYGQEQDNPLRPHLSQPVKYMATNK